MNFWHKLNNYCSLKALQYREKWVGQRQNDKISKILGGHIFFQTLVAAVRLDLFTQLSRQPGMTLQEISLKLEIEEKPSRILLLGCVSSGLIKKKGKRYFNSLISQQSFNKDSPRNLIPVLIWQHFIAYRSLYHFTEAIERNDNIGLKEFIGHEKTLYERLAFYPDLESIYQDAMESTSQMANWILQKYIDFSCYKFLLDVGGGNGANIIALSQINPNLKGCVFDLKSVCEIADIKIKEAKLSERLSVCSGDCFKDPFPEGADCILLSHFLNLWSQQECKFLLKKAYEALQTGGKLIVFSLMQHDKENGPLAAAIVSPYFLTLTTGRGMVYKWLEYENWMKEAGFNHVSRMKTIRDHGVVIGIKK